MQRVILSGWALRKKSLASFTLIELLTVIAIIAILAAMTLAAASMVMGTGARKRATAEIQAMSLGLENYKIDNGIYPSSTSTVSGVSGTTLTGPPTGSYPFLSVDLKDYKNSASALYEALSGKTNFMDIPQSGTKSYFSFKVNQIGNPTAAAGPSYVADPWSNPYGYSTGDNLSPQVNYPFNGSQFFDLWTTAGTTGNTTSNPKLHQYLDQELALECKFKRLDHSSSSSSNFVRLRMPVLPTMTTSSRRTPPTPG